MCVKGMWWSHNTFNLTLKSKYLVDKTGSDEPKVDEIAVDKIAVDEIAVDEYVAVDE